MSDAIKMQGGRELRHLLEELPKRVRTKGLRRAVSLAASPLVKATKQRTKRRTGLLKKAITKKVKTYRGGNVCAAIVGANREATGTLNGKTITPNNYFHLVDKGVPSRGIPAQHMLEDAHEATKAEAGHIMLDTLQNVLESEAEKLAGK